MRALPVLALLASLALAEDPPKPGPGDTRPVEKALDDMGEILKTRPEKTLAIAWVMDASGSMTDDRQRVLGKLDELLQKLSGKEVRMTVLAFDKKPRVVCPLSTDWDRVKKAIGGVGEGKGEENCMLAVREAAKLVPTPGSYRVVVLMTDERGDDEDDLEKTIQAVKQSQVHVFVLGRETPFGWPIGYEADEELGFNVTVDAGVESAAIETLQKNPLCCGQEWYPYCRKMLTDPDKRPQESYFQDGDPLGCDLGRDEEVRSGFAPWAQARLCAETGGQVWLIRGKGGFDAKALRGYEPDLCAVAEYGKRNAADPLRKAVTEVLAEIAKGREWKLESVGLSEGQAERLGKRARELTGNCRKWIDRLRAARPNLPSQGEAPSKRWVAHRDLLVAQLHVLIHWLEQYALVLKEGDYPKGGDVALAPGDLRGSGEAKLEAVRALEQVMKDHPGTPWAETAAALAEGLDGFDLVAVRYGSGGAGPSAGDK